MVHVHVSFADEDVIMHMWETPLHHTDRNNARLTFLVGKIKMLQGKYTVILQSMTGSHVVKALLKKLEKSNETVSYMNLYLNNSPCSECADELSTYLDTNEEVQLTMYVANLHMVRRESCARQGHSNCISEETVHNEGLRVLKNRAHCRIEGFEEKNWRELFYLMKMSDEFITRCLNTYCTPQAISRREYDENIKSDLNNI